MQNSMEMLNEKIKKLQEENESLKYRKHRMNINRDKYDDEDLEDIDKKDVEKPEKYKGDTNKWRHWTIKLRTYLSRRDHRWPKLMEAVKSKSQNPIAEKDRIEIFHDLGVKNGDLMRKFEDQLYEYLESFTMGPAHAMVIAGGSDGVLEVYRQMCDEGHSQRDRHLRKEYRRVTHPAQATFDTLKKAILDWETDLAEYETASGTSIDLKTKLLCLEDICPVPLQQHLDSKENLTTYAGYKTVVNDYMINRQRWTDTKGKLNWLGLSEEVEQHDGTNNEEDQGDNDEEHPDAKMQINSIMGELMALVKSKFDKKPKGGGKGGSKGGKGGGKDGAKAMDVDNPVCYECGEPMKLCGHSAKDCPIRKARVAAGGPERVPKGGGKGGKGGAKSGGKGTGSNWPTRAQWWQYYPGPSQTQWKGWYPQPLTNGKVNLFEQPHQLSAVSPLQALLAGPSAYSITPKAKDVPDKFKVGKKETPKFEHKNSFSELVNRDDDGTLTEMKPKYREPLKVKIQDAVKAPSRNQEKKKRRQGKHTTMEDVNDKSLRDQVMDFVNNPYKMTDEKKKPGIRLFSEVVKADSLKPLTMSKDVATASGRFEVLSSIVDSGATIPTMHPSDAKAYELEESEASRRGVEYELANSDTVPNLGQKRFAVITAEGTLRGYQTQCAEICPGKPLQAVRALLASNHAVCFGLGDGDDHLIVNKTTGEINRMRDDGINYIQDLLIVPPDKIEEVQATLSAMQSNEGGSPWDFTRQGP